MTFDPLLHEYRDGDTVIPSVTQILKGAGLIDDRWYTEEARERGSAVHELCQRYAQGERVDIHGRGLAYLEYVNSLSAWFRDTGAYAIATEQMIEGNIGGLRYAGTFDLLAEIGKMVVLIDYKTGPGMKWHPAQIAAYALAVNPSMCNMLHLKPDGRYRENAIAGNDLLSGLGAFKDAIRGYYADQPAGILSGTS